MDNLKLPGDRPIHSTEGDLKEFLESTIWTDFKTVLDFQLEGLKNQIMGTEDLNAMLRTQGKFAGVEFWRRIPEILMERYKVERQMKEDKKEGFINE